MVSVEPGTRVFAVRNATDTTVFLYGMGVYAGDHPRPGTELIKEPSKEEVTAARKFIEEFEAEYADALTEENAKEMRKKGEPEEAVQTWIESAKEERKRPIEERAVEHAVMLHNRMALNPRIDLDNGKTVWGFQCWWGEEWRYPGWRGGRQEVNVWDLAESHG